MVLLALLVLLVSLVLLEEEECLGLMVPEDRKVLQVKEGELETLDQRVALVRKFSFKQNK